MKRILALTFALAFVATLANAGKITLTGVYQGKNLYVQNPFTGNMKDFCTDEVFVNSVKVKSNIRSSAFEIDLSHLKLNSPVSIEITHKDDCKPKILNPQVIRAQSTFRFMSFEIANDQLKWSTKGEKPKGRFIVEQFVNGSWVPKKEIKGKESSVLNNYIEDPTHHSGENKYRIKYLESDGQVFYSKVETFTSNLAPVDFFPKRVSNKIYLSRVAEYQVLDAYGNVVKEGEGKEIECLDLSEGVYYLNVDNRTHKFLKK